MPEDIWFEAQDIRQEKCRHEEWLNCTVKAWNHARVVMERVERRCSVCGVLYDDVYGRQYATRGTAPGPRSSPEPPRRPPVNPSLVERGKKVIVKHGGNDFVAESLHPRTLEAFGLIEEIGLGEEAL